MFRLLLTWVVVAGMSVGFGQWAFMSEQKLLENKSIVASVEIEQLQGSLGSRPIYWTSFVSAIGRDLCFSLPATPGFWGYGKKAGLLLVDSQRTFWVAILESSIGSIKVTVLPISIQGCP